MESFTDEPPRRSGHLDTTIMMGKPVIKGTRIPVELILRRLGAGDGEQQILTDYPGLTIEDVRAAQTQRWRGTDASTKHTSEEFDY